MKRIILFCILSIFGNCLFSQSDLSKPEIKISFQKEIILEEELNGPTIYFAKIDSHLLLYDAHVSERKLICLDVFSGKTEWEIDKPVFNFFIYENKLVIDFDSYIALYKIETGEEIWRTNSGSIAYNNKLAEKVSKNLLIDYEGKKTILNLETQTIDTVSTNIVSAHYFKVIGEKTEEFIIGIQNTYKTQHELLSFIIVEDLQGLKRDYVGSINKELRIFYLDTYNEKGVKINSEQWDMDETRSEHSSVDLFNGYPEPQKLDYSVHFVNGKLFLYEDYTIYRWSWGRGSNRINCIDWQTGSIKYQKWGHAPSDKLYLTANKFHFFDYTILYADNIMNFQDGNGKFWNINEETGEILDSLKMQNTLFRNYDEKHMVAFTYERKLVKEQEYTNAIEMRLWNTEENTFSKTFRFDYNKDYPYEPKVFPDLGLIVLSVYKESINRSVIHVYNVNHSRLKED